MDRRLTVLETRFDTILPTLATKADLVELRLDLERMFFNLQAKLNDDINKVFNEMNKLRVEVHTSLMSMAKWCIAIAIAITVILGVVSQGIYLNKQIADQSVHLSKQITDQSVHLSKQIADLAARLPPAGAPAAAAPHRPSAAELASASPPQAGAITAHR
ncbi:hypothetical protein F2P45_08550 [Massilia sp. CCM 8733]|uniref:Uncharacterized protein n=1 Tax=Massilia mucilaginosa TaxID=2609282 RepID=A0ABX0NQL4_9BURK|nr:hypothetical protein [Massilia mucilaginosa]NHZ89066.1 hypothetical protein [Massilia mucilaginosa]